MRQANQQHGSEPALSLRPWQRLSIKLACLLAAVTLCAVAAVGGLTYKRHQRELEDTVGTQLLNIARVTALAVDPALHAQVQRGLDSRSPAYLRIKRELLTIRNEVLLTTPIYTLADFDPATRTARLMVVSDGPGAPGELYHVPRALIDPMRWTFRLRQLLAFADPPASQGLSQPATRGAHGHAARGLRDGEPPSGA